MRLRVLGLACALVACLFTTGTAAAAASFPRIDAATVDGFKMTAGQTFENYGARLAQLERNAQLKPRGLSEILQTANRKARPLCHGTYLASALKPAGFCWEDANDDKTNDWIPQGLTGSGDASPTGKVDGKRVVAASWHTPGDTMVRLSFADATALTYRHVLLVEPTSNTDFAVVTGHGHGMTWVDNRLYVATAGGVIRVFDTSHFWKVDDSLGTVGLGSDGKYHAAFYDYALPQIGAFWYPGGGCTTAVGDRPCISTLSFDASSSSFITAEHAAKEGGRVLRWPFDRAAARLKTGTDGLAHASEGFLSPVWGVQGAVARNGYFVFTGVCPEYAADPTHDHPSCLHGGVGGASTSRLTGQAPVNSQNLSYWPATGELWLINEQLRERVTVHVPWTTLTGRP
ncbi:hypothetical protein SAMN05421504_105143 [Amycolatopsis xylanica]|uniref:Secreted protein n=1 Tax=Amycolatopsis xylanica TaxID=589385 RepID=A0A1H3IX64_9PSEU|nr:hypothetical protein [Amycolatopsis xylanica]SDY31925.1 hypothetical protein SAMN05421504_105143 [Amycolatopsis xylanica]